MEISEYKNIYDNEDSHFFYVSTHFLVISLIKHFASGKNLKILDAGCGTGLLTKKLAQFGDVTGIDFSLEALKFAKKRGLHIKIASIEKLPFKNNTFDIVVSIDVLTAKSIKNDLVPLAEFYRILKPGGTLILRVSANNWLRLNHDQHVHMRQRYSKEELSKKLSKVGFLIKKLSYVNFSLLLPLILRFILEKKFHLKTSSAIGETNPIINNLLTKVLLLESKIFPYLNFPFGIGLITVCQKEDNNSPRSQIIKTDLASKFKKVKTILTVFVLTVSIIYLLRSLSIHYEQAKSSLFSVSPLKLIAAFFCFLIYLYMRALSWKEIANSLGSSINKKDSFSIWFISEATRYIPGNIWSFISRAYLARQKNMTWNSSILMLPIEIIFVLAVTSILSLYALFKTLEILPKNLVFNITGILSLVSILGLLLLQKRIKDILKRMSQQTFNLGCLSKSLLFQLIGWSFYSFAAIILINSYSNLDPLLLFSCSLLAWLIGYLSIVTPMGLGVRESAFVFLTGSQIGLTQAVLLAVLHRLILTIAELTNLAFWVSLTKIKNFKSNDPKV